MNSVLSETINSSLQEINNAIVKFFPSLILVAIVLIVSFVVIKLIQFLFNRALNKTRLDEDITYLLYKASGWIMWFLVLVWVIGSLGLNAVFASLLGVGALAGLAVAMAVKDSLNDVVSGIILLQDKHFDLSDKIETSGKKGIIEEVGLRKTRLRLSDGSLQVIPNRKIDSSGWQLIERAKGKKI